MSHTHVLLTKDRKKRVNKINGKITALDFRRGSLSLFRSVLGRIPQEHPKRLWDCCHWRYSKCLDKGLSDLLWLNLWSSWSGERLQPLFCGTLTICWSPALTCSILSLLSYPQTLLLPSSPLLPLQSLKAGPPHFLWKITHCQYLTWFWHLLPNLLGFACLVKADLNEKRLDILPSPFFFIFAILLTVHYFCRKHV